MTTQEKIRKRDEIIREWANTKLKQRGLQFDEFTELKDGVKLLHLAEILSSESVGRFYHNPKNTVYMAENCSILLNFLKAKGLTNLRVTSQGIVDGNESSIISVLWQMMLTWEKNSEEFRNMEEPIPSPRPLSSNLPPISVTKPGSSSPQSSGSQIPSSQGSLTQETSRNLSGKSADDTTTTLSSSTTITNSSPSSSTTSLATVSSALSVKSSRNPPSSDSTKVNDTQYSKSNVDNKSFFSTKSEETKDDKESEKLTGLRTKSATVSVPNSTQRENRNMIELTGDAKVIAFIQSALPDLNTERQATLEVNSTVVSPTSPRQKPAIPPRPHRPSLALPTGIDSKAPPPEPPPKIVQSQSVSESLSSEQRITSRQEITRRIDSSPNLFKEGGESTTVKPPYSARNPPSPHSKSKLPSSYTQNEILNENAQLRKENEMLKKMNDVLKRELERRKSFSVPAEAASNVPKDLRQAQEEIQRLQALLKTKDKEIEKLKRENELLYKELDHMAKKMRKKSWGLFPDDVSTGSGSSRATKESSKVLSKLNPLNWFKGDKVSPRDSQVSYDSMAEDISEDFDEIEKALVTIQTYIRRYYALAKYHQLQQLYQLSKVKGFPEAVIKIQAAIRMYNSWETLQRIKSYRNHPQQIILIQAVLRRHLAIQNYRMAKKRKYVATELRDTEKSYIDGLQALNDVFLIPLKTNGLISQEQIRIIFSELQVITAYNRMLLAQLEQRVAKWNYDACIGDIFQKIADFLKVYTTYCNNYNRAIETVHSLRRTNTAFNDFLIKGRQDPRCKELEFMDLLVLPIQRIPRYVMLLEDLLRHTPKSHRDYERLSKSLSHMRNVAAYVNERKRENENLQSVLRIQSLLINYTNLAKPARRYIDEGSLILLDPQTNKKKQLYFFLFNDLLLGAKKNKQKIVGLEIGNQIASKITGVVDKTYKFVIEIPITHESKVVDAGQKLQGKPTFQLVSGDKTLSLAAENEDEKQKWFQSIQTVIEEQIKKNQSMKVEAPLEKLIKKRESRKMRKYYQLQEPTSKATEKSGSTDNQKTTSDSSGNTKKNEEQKSDVKRDKERKKEKQSDTHSRRNTLDNNNPPPKNK